MNNEIEYLVSQMNPGQLNAFINQSFPGLVGGNFMFQQGQTEQDKKRIVADKLSKAVASPAMNATQESVIGSLGKYVSPEVRQPQQTGTANVGDYTKFADDSYTAGDNDYADFDSYDDNVSSRRLQPNATKPQGVSQTLLDLVGIQNALAQDPNWQPRDDYEKWVVGQLQGAEWSPNPTLAPANVNRTAGVQTPKSQDEKYQFNVLEDRENRIANVQNIPIPKPVGIRTNLQTGLVYDYNQGLVYDPNTGITQKILSKGLFPTPRTIPDVIQGEQSNFIPVPPIESRLDLDPNQDLSPQARQYLVDRQWGKDKEQAYIQQQDAVNNQLTDGEGRFFGTANYQSKRDNSVPYKRAIGISPRVAGIGQEYSPEVMSRVGQGGFLNNAGSIILPQTWIDKETNERVFSKGRGTATTIIYEGGKDGVAIPKISIPRVEGSGNELVSFEDAVKRQLISPEQYNNYINQASQTRFIPANNMDGFNRDNVKLYEASDWNPETKREENYRATYMNPLTKEVYNVTQNGRFYLVRPGVSKEASGLPTYDDATNLAQEMTDINRAMKEGGRDNLVDVIRENPDNPGLEAFTRPIPAINPITGETINKYVHSKLVEKFNPATGQIEKSYVDTRTPNRWVDEDNPQELFNYFNANQESSGQSMEALDLARGGNRTAGVKKAPFMDTYNDSITSTPVFDYYNEDKDRTVRDVPEFKGYQDSRQQTNIQYELRYDKNGVLYLGKDVVAPKQETTIFNSGNPIIVSAPTGYQNTNATSAYPSLQETDYLAGRLAFNASGNIVDVPSQQLAAKGINNFTPASEFYTNTSQLVRDKRTGKVIYDPNKTVYVRTGNTGFDDGDFAVVPYKEDKRIARVNQVVPSSSVLPVYSYPYQEGDDGSATLFNPLLGEKPKEQAVVVGKNNGYTLPEIKSYQAEEVYPEDFANTQFYRFKTNPETPLRAYRVNEFGNVETNDGVPIEALTPKYSNGLPLPRSAQIANFQRGEDMRGAEAYPILRKDVNGNIQFVESPVRSGRKISLAPEDWEGVLPDSKSVPEGMSYDEAKDKGLLNPVWDKSRPFTALDGSYQIPLPKGVGLARVLDESDPRTQAALAAQAIRRQIPSLVEQRQSILADNSFTPEEKSTKVKKLFAHPLEILGSDEVDALIKIAKKGESRPAFDRKYTIAPGRTAGIESPQYAQYTDLTDAKLDYKYSSGDDTRRFWKEDLPGIIPQGVIEGAYLPVTVTPRPVNAEGRKGWLYPDQIYTTESGREVRGDKALNYVNVPLNLDSVRSYLPPGKREELVAKGFDDDAIDNWYSANPNLGRDNALANAKISIDGQYYDVTPQATVAEFNPVAGGNYAMAEIRSQGRAARIDLPFKAGANISEPTPEWIAQQAVNGKLNFNADDYIRPDDAAILNQKEVYNAGYEEPTDILGAINRTQQKKNQIDAVISNTEQRLKEQYGLAGNQVMLSNDFGTGLLDKSVGSVVNGEYVTTSSMPDLAELKAKSNQLAEEINRASVAHNAIINIEDSPEVIVTRRGNYTQLENFIDGARALGLEDYNITGDKQASMIGSLPNNLLPYEQAKTLNQSRLLPAYRTQQKVKLPTVPTSNVVNLGRVKVPFPEEVVTTQQFVPAGNQVVPLNNQSVSDIVPSSSWQSTNQEVVENPRMRRRNQTPGVANSVFSMGGNTPNIPLEPDVRMTGGMNIPKWAIPATLGAVWLGLAANARRQQDEERRQQQGVVNRY